MKKYNFLKKNKVVNLDSFDLKTLLLKTSGRFFVEYYGKIVGCNLQLAIQISCCAFSATTKNEGPLIVPAEVYDPRKPP